MNNVYITTHVTDKVIPTLMVQVDPMSSNYLQNRNKIWCLNQIHLIISVIVLVGQTERSSEFDKQTTKKITKFGEVLCGLSFNKKHRCWGSKATRLREHFVVRASSHRKCCFELSFISVGTDHKLPKDQRLAEQMGGWSDLKPIQPIPLRPIHHYS